MDRTEHPDHTHVLLLRGVNVGGRNRVPKAELAELAAEAGAQDATVHLNSGNVLCRIGERHPAAEVAQMLARLILARLDVETPVHEATAAEIASLLDAWEASDLAPTEQELADGRFLPRQAHLVLLDSAPDPEDAARLQAEDFGEDRCLVAGRGVWIRYAVDTRSSRLTLPRIERILGRSGTARNLNTVKVLAGRPEPKKDLPRMAPRRD